MRIKFVWLFLLLLSLFFYPVQSTMANPYKENVESKFIHALLKQDEKLAQLYLDVGVKIPEIQESTLLALGPFVPPCSCLNKDQIIVLRPFQWVDW